MFEPQHKPEYLLSCMQDTEDRRNNKAAYIILQIPEYEEPEIHVFEAVSPRPKVVSAVNDDIPNFSSLLVLTFS